MRGRHDPRAGSGPAALRCDAPGAHPHAYTTIVIDAREPKAREGALACALVGQALRGAALIDYEKAYVRRLCDFEQALAWGDDWERAYQEERREHLREVKRLQDRIFQLEHQLKTKELEHALDKAIK